MEERWGFTLPNGIRVVHVQATSTRLVHCGMILDVGSRDENTHELGIAHFIEHMIFKGTRKRKAYHILTRIDSVGGELNAFTTKEKTTYHATVLAEHVERAVELLADITFASTFPQHEIEKEKSVIAEEIDMYRDDPEEAIFEDFDTLIFPNHPLGHPILGTKELLTGFTTDRLVHFFTHHYGTHRLVFSMVGNVDRRTARRLAEKYFGAYVDATQPIARLAPAPITAQLRTDPKPIQQAHFILGGRAYPWGHELHAATQLLNNTLGGPSMNSRLSLNIRERYGLAYNIQSFYQPFVDTGIWGVYAGCEVSTLPRLRRLVARELASLVRIQFSSLALARLKKQLIGNLIIGGESHFAQMLAYGKDVLDFGHPFALEDLVAEVEAVTPAQVQQVAKELFAPEQLSVLTFLPTPD